MSTQNLTNVSAGMYGNDNGHDFRIINERQSEIQVEYVEDGRQAWFLRSRFERDENGELCLI
jgi:hypothetical protein